MKTGTRKKSASFLSRFIAGASWISVLLLWGCAASVHVSPEWFRFVGVIGLGFPFFLGGTLFMLAVSLLFAPRRAWIPLLGLAGCCCSIRTYCPFNLTSPPPKGCLKILTYNTLNFGGLENDEKGRNRVALYMGSTRSDIICFQEGSTYKNSLYEDMCRLAGATYMDTVNLKNNILGCYSRYPIVGREVICSNAGNGSVVFRILLGRGDTLRMVNCHLASMQLTVDDRAMYHEMVLKPEEADVGRESRLLVSKIAAAAARRAGQADSVAEWLSRHKGENIVVCGDFNDSPISYTRRRIAEGLTDAYVATANGIGRSFNRDAIYVRIDNILVSDHWKPYSCRLDRSVLLSDHYPMSCYLKRQKDAKVR